MRAIIYSGLILLLTGCTATSMPTNNYTQSVLNWRGGNVSQLVQQWGQPNQRISKANGHTLYIYKTQSYSSSYASTSAPVGTKFSGSGRPQIVTTSNTPDNRIPMPVTCTATFETNANGVIVMTQVQGLGCSK